MVQQDNGLAGRLRLQSAVLPAATVWLAAVTIALGWPAFLEAAKPKGRFVGTVEAVDEGQLTLRLSPDVQLAAGEKLLIGKSLISKPHGQVTVAGASQIMTTATADGVDAQEGYILWLLPQAYSGPGVGELEKLIGQRLDVDTHGGNEYRQAELRGVRRKEGADSDILSIQVAEPEDGEERSISFLAIARLAIDGHAIHTSTPPERPAREEAAEDDGAPAAERPARSKRLGKGPRITADQWLEIATARGVKPWSELSEMQHEQTIAEHRRMMDEVSQQFPGMAAYETDHFLVLSNIPAQQIRQYITELDTMHATLVQMFELPKGSRVWRGKALVIAFIEREQFFQFEARFMRTTPAAGTYGICHQRSDGHAVMACYRGDNAADFGQMLIHETSHGFIHRFLSAERLPAWLNEGLSEWIGEKLVPQSNQVDLKMASAKRRLQETRSFEGMFEAERPLAWHYGAGASLANYLITADSQRFAILIRLIKAGMSFEEALAQSYGGTLEQFVAAYGQSIGVPDLKP